MTDNLILVVGGWYSEIQFEEPNGKSPQIGVASATNSDPEEIAAMPIVTPTLLDALRTSWSAAFNSGFQGAKSEYKNIAMIAPSSTRSTSYGWLGQMPMMREWIGEKRIKAIQTFGFAIENRPFESTLEVHKHDIADDNIGIYGSLFSQLGLEAARLPDRLIFELLANGFTGPCYDGQNFFDTDHPTVDKDGNATIFSNMQAGVGTPWFLFDTTRPVRAMIYQEREPFRLFRVDDPNDAQVFKTGRLQYGAEGRCNVGYGLPQVAFGSKETLNAANFVAARQAMTELRGDGGQLLGIRPNVCVVGAANENAAKDLFLKQNLMGGESNTLYKEVELIITPWLA